jgi:hypothetical protein
MNRILLGGVVGGALLFICGAVSHMALPIWNDAFGTMADEPAVMAAIQASIKESGVYAFPEANMKSARSDDEQKKRDSQPATGPGGLIIFRTDSPKDMTAKQLGLELASNIAGALLVAVVLYQVRGGYPMRVLTAGLFGAVAWLSISASYWNWYGFSYEFSKAEAIDQVGSWLVAGLVMAFIVRPNRSPAAKPA